MSIRQPTSLGSMRLPLRQARMRTVIVQASSQRQQAAAAILAGLLALSAINPEAAEAGRSSGRVGGSSFSSARVARAAPPRARAAPPSATRAYSGGGTTIIAPPLFSPFGYGFGGPMMFSPMGFGMWGGFSSFLLTITSMGVMYAIVNYVLRSEGKMNDKDDDEF